MVGEQLGKKGSVQIDSNFIDDLDADSLDTIELIMSLEEEFGVRMPTADPQIHLNELYFPAGGNVISCLPLLPWRAEFQSFAGLTFENMSCIHDCDTSKRNVSTSRRLRLLTARQPLCKPRVVCHLVRGIHHSTMPSYDYVRSRMQQ